MIIKKEGKTLGILEDGTYISKRIASRHYYIKGGGYPISNSVLKKIKDLGCFRIVISEQRANGSVHDHWCWIEDYMNAVLIHEPGHDEQRCLPLKLMHKLG